MRLVLSTKEKARVSVVVWMVVEGMTMFGFKAKDGVWLKENEKRKY